MWHPAGGKDRWTLVTMNEAGIFSQVDVIDEMVPILNKPVPATQLQKPVECPHFAGHTRDPTPLLPMLHPVLLRASLEAEELSHTQPVG